MKKFLAVLLMLAMLLCGVAFAEDTAPALTKDVVVLFTSDVHCGIDQGWGYAGVANMRNSLQADNHVVLVADGGARQGVLEIAAPQHRRAGAGQAIMNLITAWRTSSN